MGRGLSEQQKAAIRRIGDELIQRKGQYDQADDERRKYMRLFGAKCPSDTQTESGWASWARTLRRLQDRGLVVRRGLLGNWLTAAGWTTYRQLTGKDVPIVLLNQAYDVPDGDGRPG
jgi:hypothetical protein